MQLPSLEYELAVEGNDVLVSYNKSSLRNYLTLTYLSLLPGLVAQNSPITRSFLDLIDSKDEDITDSL